MRHLLVRLALALCSAAAALPAALAQQPAEPYTASVGLKLLKLPVPAGAVEPSRSVPPLRQMAERMTPPSNRLLALFVEQADETVARAGQPPSMARYYMVQSLRQTEAGSVGVGEFREVRQMLRQQYQQILVQAAPQVQGHLDSAAQAMGRDSGVEGLQLKVGEMKGLDVFDEREHSISLLALTQVEVQAGDRVERAPMAMSITTGILQGKVVYFYAYARYTGPADLEWLRQVTRDWVQRAAQANP